MVMVECKEKTCLKISYQTKKEAQEIINISRKVTVFDYKIGEYRRKRKKYHNNKEKRLENSYLCPTCNYWHITSKK
jgi:ribosomal protein L44E